MNKFILTVSGQILVALAIIIASLAIIAASYYALHAPAQSVGTADTIEHNPNMQLETK